MEAMELVQQSKAFNHEDWFYEIKYDGFRGLAYVENGSCQLVSCIMVEFDVSVVEFSNKNQGHWD